MKNWIILFFSIIFFFACAAQNEDIQIKYDGNGEPILQINNRNDQIYGSVKIGFGEDGKPFLKSIRGGTRKTNRCATPIIKAGFKLYKKAKKYLAAYYKTREMSDLYFAWYSAEDAKYLAHEVRKCKDKKNTHFYAVQNLLKYSNTVELLIIPNLKEPEIGMATEIYLDKYQELIPNEIQ